MDVLVCFKLVPDLDRLSGNDWVIQDQDRIDTSFVPTMINPYDESALELALRLADSAQAGRIPCCLSALTLDGRRADPALKTLLALRFEQAVRVEAREDWRFQPEAVAAVIAAYARNHQPQDVLIFGRQSGEGDNGKTPLLVAERLQWPCVTDVLAIETIEANESNEGRLRIRSRSDDGVLTQVISPPCVLSVGNVAGTALRVPTLKARMMAGKRPVKVIDGQLFGAAAALAAARQDYALQGLTVINHQRAGVILDGSQPAAAAKRLYADYLKARLEAL